MAPDIDPAPALDPEGERYELVRKLGRGGSGVVYLVRDRETGEQLAWKQLQHADERSITRLKREFRALSNINHPNVVRLYHLGRTRDAWFLTMEYLDGPTLLDYLDARHVSASLRETSTLVGIDAIDLPRIIDAFRQLATGVSALHRAGVLHRDLKPSNVIVPAGRVVVLDFGLALTLGDGAATITMDAAVAGTPAYMAPEQLQGSDWSEPNDWYAFGVMLYEALTGCLPIEGRLQELLRRKLEQDPVPVERHVSGLPAPLVALCNGLVQRKPEQRPSGAQVLAVLERCAQPVATAAAPQPPRMPRPADGSAHLFGREAESAQLRAARAELAQGSPVVVHVSGVSGAGKSALLARFLDELEQAETVQQCRTLVLRGRCYERETVAFKALDAVMDALVTQLGREDDLEISHILPRDVPSLVQLFPVLTRLSPVRRLLPEATRNLARPQAREAAEAALRDLFTRLSTRRSVIVWIDDLHWGDPDSARILKGLLSAAGIPGLMLVLSYRSDEVSTSPCLRLLLDDEAQGVRRHQLLLGGLPERHIRALCLARFAHAGVDPQLLDAIVEHIVSEADGSPFLASQLTVLALSELGETQLDAAEVLTIESLVARRTADLSDGARKLLNVLSVAGRPLALRLALQLSAASSQARAVVHELSGLGLVRSRSSDGERLLSVYHERLSEAVLTGLPAAERTRLERQLLEALAADGGAEPAWLHALALGAGEHAAALEHGTRAAERALDALAFERAAELYRACLALQPPEPVRLDLWQKLALALGHSGRGRQAAAAYREAAQYAQGMQRLRLERSAASHLLRSGAFEEGEALLQKVLSELKLETPSGNARILAAIGWERARLSLRSLDVAKWSPTQVSPALYFEGYLCGTLSIELQPHDPLRAALFQARSLRIALDVGVPELLARALCVAATMAAVSGGKDAGRRAEELLGRADALEQKNPSPLVRGNICSARAVCAIMRGDMGEVVQQAAEAERMFREGSGGDDGEYYHRFNVIGARVTALFELGQPQLAQTELQRAVSEARATENVAALLSLSAIRTRAEIAADQATRALLRIEGEGPQLPPQRFGLLHVNHLISVMRVGCATGEHAWALGRIRDGYDQLERAVRRRAGPFAHTTPALHARLLLNHAVATGLAPAEARRSVERDLRTLAASPQPRAASMLARTRARLALIADERALARAELERSLSSFEQLGVVDEAARDRYALAMLLGVEGAPLQASALSALRQHGYANPERDVRSHYPELFVFPG